jgi:hypothetical protein
MDIDDLDDDDDWIAYEGDVPSGQSQLEMMNIMLGTQDVHVIGVETKHRSHRVLVETVDVEATCPTCGSPADPVGRVGAENPVHPASGDHPVLVDEAAQTIGSS